MERSSLTDYCWHHLGQRYRSLRINNYEDLVQIGRIEEFYQLNGVMHAMADEMLLGKLPYDRNRIAGMVEEAHTIMDSLEAALVLAHQSR